MKVLVSGAAGFIGFFTAQRLLDRGDEVIGVDNLNKSYDVNLKRARLSQLRRAHGFDFVKLDVTNRIALLNVVRSYRPRRIVHLAARANIGKSRIDPMSFVQANTVGFANVLDVARESEVEHLVYASTSSVYGAATPGPSSERADANYPLSMYAATKRSNELIAHAYSHLYGLPTTGLRYFTVYGPWGRPDQALSIFTRQILAGSPIDVFNCGRHTRDFVYVDDVVVATLRALDNVPVRDPESKGDCQDSGTPSPFRLYNVGTEKPINLLRYIELLEQLLGRAAKEKRMLPMRPEDAPDTWSDSALLVRDLGCLPSTPLETGVQRFVDWYRWYYRAATLEAC